MKKGVQYISCYSLSEKFAVSDYIVNKFQYISCYSLSFTGRREKREIAVSIHLMLLFIRVATVIESCFAKFQYISCYSLSALYYSDQALETCFNTSHVTLYLFDNGNIRYLYEFQYISCYSLSIFLLEIQHNEQNVSIHLMLLFIHGNSLVYLSLIRFNTSHVTLYLFL